MKWRDILTASVDGGIANIFHCYFLLPFIAGQANEAYLIFCIFYLAF